MKKHVKKIILPALILVMAAAGFLIFIKENRETTSQAEDNRNQAQDDRLYQLCKENGYETDLNRWLHSLPGKDVYVENGSWCIDGMNIGIPAAVANRQGREAGIFVKDIQVTPDNHLVIICSNNEEVDLGGISQGVLKQLDLPQKSGEEESLSKEDSIQEKEMAEIEISDVEVKPGSKNVQIIATVKNNPGILGMILAVDYDEKAMKLTKVTNGACLKHVLNMTKGKVLESGCKIVWDGQDIKKSEVKDGEILVMNFDILDQVGSGEYKISFSYRPGEVVDHQLNPVKLHIKSGKASVSE